MPQLREDGPAGFVHGINHLLPARQGFVAIKGRYVRVTVGRRVVHYGALGNDQANTGFGTAAIVIDHILTRYAVG